MLHSLLCSQPKANVDLDVFLLIKHTTTLVIISSINKKRMGITPGGITKVGFLQQWLTKPCFEGKSKKKSIICFKIMANKNVKV